MKRKSSNFKENIQLFEGTKIIESKSDEFDYGLGIVTNIGFYSSKGKLIRLMLNP